MFEAIVATTGDGPRDMQKIAVIAEQHNTRLVGTLPD